MLPIGHVTSTFFARFLASKVLLDRPLFVRVPDWESGEGLIVRWTTCCEEDGRGLDAAIGTTCTLVSVRN